MRRWLRARLFRYSCDLLARSKLAERHHDTAYAARLKYRSRIWFGRHLLVAGLLHWGSYRHFVAETKAARLNGRTAILREAVQ